MRRPSARKMPAIPTHLSTLKKRIPAGRPITVTESSASTIIATRARLKAASISTLTPPPPRGG